MTAFPRCPECNGQRAPMNYVGDVVGAVCMCPVSKSTLYGPWNSFDMGNWSEFTKMLVAERDRLRAEVEALKADNRHLRGKFEKAWPDAERYRWLLKNSTYTNGVKCLNGEVTGPAYRRWYHDSDRLQADTLDAAIDAARAAQGVKP